MPRFAAVIVSLTLAVPVLAQSVGRLKPVTDNTAFNLTDNSVAINLDYPATDTGNLTTATLNWVGSACPGAFKLKFYRRGGSETYTQIAERGPFDSASGLTTVTLSPPVAIQKSDVIGVVYVRSDCGAPVGSATDPTKITTAVLNADVQTFDLKNATVFRGTELNVRASADPSVFEGTIPVAGAAQGAFGSNFRTSVTLTNMQTGNRTISGKLVFHPAGKSASASDPSVPYNLPAGKTVSFADIVTSLGKTGLGSIDLLSTSSYRPVVTARVFDDRGLADGTAGFTEDFVNQSDILVAPEQAFFPIPSELVNFRQNIGIRTFDDGASISFIVFNGTNNGVLATFDKDYPPNFFEQLSASFLFGTGYVSGGVIRIRIKSGSAVFYVSTTDNRTNDPSAQFGRRE